MAITILSKKYSTRNNPSGNTFLLANSGQLITETLEFTIDFDFVSSTQFPVTFPSNFQIQLLAGEWGDFGFNIGDAIQLTGETTISCNISEQLSNSVACWRMGRFWFQYW